MHDSIYNAKPNDSHGLHRMRDPGDNGPCIGAVADKQDSRDDIMV